MNDINCTAKYSLGQIIKHSKFDYRGVIFDVDAQYEGSSEWYDDVAKSRPPKDRPWYHVMVDNSDVTTYVAERHLHMADDLSVIQHPLLDIYFDVFIDGRYSLIHRQTQ